MNSGSKNHTGDILPTSLANGRLVVDHLGYEMRVDGSPVGLTITELKVLEILIINRRHFMKKEDISQALYGIDVSPEAPPQYIGQLRRKIGAELGVVLKNKRGSGYRIDDSFL